MAGQPTPPNVPSLRNKGLIRPISEGGTLGEEIAKWATKKKPYSLSIILVG